MILTIYLTIGMLYWALNSFVRKLDTNEDWLLPVVWFLGWPFALITWTIILTQYLIEYYKNKFSKNQI